MICPAESPEGAKIGLVKNLSLMTKITTGIQQSENFFHSVGVQIISNHEIL
jgi:DNA-directed RNA polymerase II subunit RPB2